MTNIVWFALLIARVDLLWSSKIDGATPESSEMCLFPGSVRGKLAYWPFFSVDLISRTNAKLESSVTICLIKAICIVIFSGVFSYL